MKIKSYYNWLLYRLFEGIFYCLLALLKFMPVAVFRRFTRPFLGLIIRVVVPRRRVIGNLGGAFGYSYAAATKDGLAKGVQEHFIQNLMDCFLQLGDPGRARRIIALEGIDHLKQALEKKRGVLALGAHLGNFVLLGARLGIEGYGFHTLFRLPPDRGIRQIIFRYVPRFFQTVIPSLPKRAAVREILRLLKQNEIVFILGDNLKKGSVDALLFGQRVPSPRGPVSLALRSGAPVLPMYLVRNYRGDLQLVIEPELAMARSGSLPQDIGDNTRRVVVHLESLIRRYPDQWNWLTVRMSRYQAPSEPRSARSRRRRETDDAPPRSLRP